jgi:putative oxidoreductase
VTAGGAELPVTNAAIASALAIAGPGKFSLDEALGTRLPRWMAIPGAVATLGGIGLAVLVSYRKQQAHQQAAQQVSQAAEAASA